MHNLQLRRGSPDHKCHLFLEPPDYTPGLSEAVQSYPKPKMAIVHGPKNPKPWVLSSCQVQFQPVAPCSTINNFQALWEGGEHCLIRHGLRHMDIQKVCLKSMFPTAIRSLIPEWSHSKHLFRALHNNTIKGAESQFLEDCTKCLKVQTFFNLNFES